jgi:hypothetical protein
VQVKQKLFITLPTPGCRSIPLTMPSSEPVKQKGDGLAQMRLGHILKAVMSAHQQTEWSTQRFIQQQVSKT